MEVIEVFGAKMTALMAAIAIAYFLVSFAPILWPAVVAWRNSPRLSRPFVFVTVVAALVYGTFSFLGFALLLPVEAYSIFVAPSLESAGISPGVRVLRISRFFAEYWWIFVPPVQFVLTWFVTAYVGRRWQHICAAPPNNSFKPNPLRGSA
jgi:hypothetical protein